MTADPDRLLEPVVELAREAGEHILGIYDRDFTVVSKMDASPLTAADIASHRHIVDGLNGLTPGIPVLSEESKEIPWEERKAWSEYWLVDPLDGTKEFVNRNGEFTVNIALIQDHAPVMGVVHVPVKGEDYYGIRGIGAWRRTGDADAVRIHIARLSGGPVRVVGSRSHRGAALDAYLEKLGHHELVSMGSSLKFCLVAEGRADVYPRLGPTSEWDTGAAQAVVEAAGGRVVDTAGEPLAYNTKAEFLNPWFIAYGDDARDWTAYVPKRA